MVHEDDDVVIDSDLEDEDMEEELEIFLPHRNKSDSYQYRIIEIAIDPFVLSDFASEDGLGAQVNTSSYSEELIELRQQLMQEMRRLIKTVLTKRQRQVINLRLQGKTQVEIGNKLGICQTTVHKTISGNIDYPNGGLCYGGAIKKLRKISSKDERIIAILERMKELRVEENS